jgi:hypothetical protein
LLNLLVTPVLLLLRCRIISEKINILTDIEFQQVLSMKTVAFITLGCKVNIYETEGMKRIFEEGGYEVVPPDCAADVYVINTCTVTHLSERKSRQMIRRAKRINPRAIIAAVGCYSQIAPEEALLKWTEIKKSISGILRKPLLCLRRTETA